MLMSTSAEKISKRKRPIFPRALIRICDDLHPNVPPIMVRSLRVNKAPKRTDKKRIYENMSNNLNLKRLISNPSRFKPVIMKMGMKRREATPNHLLIKIYAIQLPNFPVRLAETASDRNIRSKNPFWNSGSSSFHVDKYEKHANANSNVNSNRKIPIDVLNSRELKKASGLDFFPVVFFDTAFDFSVFFFGFTLFAIPCQKMK
jgi:hypothetical protein